MTNSSVEEVLVAMAQTYLWRAEVDRVRFQFVVDTLVVNQILSEKQLPSVYGLMDDLFPEIVAHEPEGVLDPETKEE